MKKKESAIEVKVGALVLFSLALLGGFVFLLGDFAFEKGSLVYVDYQDIAGLKPGAAVKQGGIQVGKVTEITFMDGERNAETGEPIWARVELEVDRERLSALRVSSEFFITTEGVLGEKFVSVRTPNPDAEAVDVGHIFRGVDPMRIEEMVAKVSTSLDNINEILGNTDMPVGDLMRHVDQLVVHSDEILVENRGRIGALLANADDLVVTARDTIAENRPAAKSLFTNADALTVDAREALGNFVRVAERLDRSTKPIVDKLMLALDNAERLSASWLRLTEEAEPKVTKMLDDATQAASDVRGATEQINALVTYVFEGQGTIGLLLRDEEIFDDLREMLRELKRRPWKMVWKE